VSGNPINSVEAYFSGAGYDYFYYPSTRIPEEVCRSLQITQTFSFRQFYSPRASCDAYVFIRKSTPLESVYPYFYESKFIGHLKLEQRVFESKNHIPGELIGIIR
ncbi:MAG: hypothetical protein LBP56_10495, partial [Odoribacteraceae bacterium]|nr:hypothetical protein [Odoribacteraceae bacterium]